MTNPFIEHRDKVMGYYSTAYWLQGVVMALWSGSCYPVGLSDLCSTDDAHFQAFQEMVKHYRAHGENDPAFQSLVREVQARQQEREEADERAVRLNAWTTEVRQVLRMLNIPPGAVDDRYGWFEKQFDAGVTADAAAAGYARSGSGQVL